MITVNELKSKLAEEDVFLQVALPSCDLIPEHFHVTEVGKVQKIVFIFDFKCDFIKVKLLYCFFSVSNK